MSRSTVTLAGLMNAQLLAMITRPITLGTPVPISARTCSSLSHEDRKNIDAVFARANDGRVLDYASQYAAVICNMVSIGTGIGIVNPFVTHHFRNLEIAVLSFLPTVPFHSPILFPNSALATLLKRHLHKVYASFQASDERTSMTSVRPAKPAVKQERWYVNDYLATGLHGRCRTKVETLAKTYRLCWALFLV